MNRVLYSPITDLRHTDPLLELSSALTADPGSVMAPQEPRALQDGYYKTSGSHTGTGDTGITLEWLQEDPSMLQQHTEAIQGDHCMQEEALRSQ